MKQPARNQTAERFGGMVQIINLETERELAPVVSPENVIDLLRGAVADGQMLEYRLPEQKSRKHCAIDIFSCSAILTVYDALKPENQERFVKTCKAHPGEMARIAFSLI